METLDPRFRDREREQRDGEGEEEPEGPRFPVIVLAAPGCILALFAAMADAMVPSLNSVRLALIVGVVAAAGAVACFGVIGAKSRERHVHVAVAVAIGATIFACCATILRLT